MEYAKIPFTAITISSSCRLDRKRIKQQLCEYCYYYLPNDPMVSDMK